VPAKRLPKKQQPGEKKKPWILQEPDAPEYEPLMLTCTGCGKQVEQYAHFCSECGTVFHQRDGSRPGKKPSSETQDLAAEEFGKQMDTVEKWTRAICILGGVFFLFLMIVSFSIGLFGLLRAFVCFLFAAVCFARGIKGSGADLDILDKFPFFGWRGRPR